MISPAFIQRLLDRTDIIDLVGQTVKLKKAGANFIGLCPFHHEKSPSFTVHPTKQFFHCFGCGAHGTSIGFVMRTRHLEFIDAVKELAASQGLEVPESRGQAPRQNYDALYQCLEATARVFQQELQRENAQKVKQYLKDRAISEDTIKRFRLGYAPGHHANSSAILRQSLSDIGFKDESILIRTGLLIQRDQGGVIERFRHRLMVPIIDRKGRVIGFGGRTLGDDEPKYLNSPETEVFHKGREWFGLPQAIDAIRKEDRAIVVEGYFDAMALSQAGIHPVIASMGTAMTVDQIAVIWGMCSQMILCFDGDLAGLKAAWRAIDRLLPSLQDGKTVRIVTLPHGLDPDDCVKTQGVEKTQALLNQGRVLSEVLMEELRANYDETSEGKAGLVRRASAWLSAISQERAPIIRQDLLQQISQCINLPIASILQGLPIDRKHYGTGSSRVQAHTPHKKAPNVRQMVMARSAAQQERWGLMEALSHPESVHEVLAGAVNPNSRYSQCLQWIADRYDAGELPALWAATMEWLNAEGFGDVVADLMDSLAQEDWQPPKEEDLKFRREHKEILTMRDKSMQRYRELCEKMRLTTLSDDERKEFTTLIPLLRTIQRKDEDF